MDNSTAFVDEGKRSELMYEVAVSSSLEWIINLEMSG